MDRNGKLETIGTLTELAPDDDAVWQSYREQWDVSPGTIYLNHGSFGPPPRPVQAARRAWLQRLESQPMDFFFRSLEPELADVRSKLAQLTGTSPDNLVCVENATYGMNIVAASVACQSGDEVLLTDHEYGAVIRIWQRACQRARISSPKIAVLPLPIESEDQIVDAIFSAVTSSTRLIVVSHITSPTAVTLPVAAICRRVRERGIMTCVDGPHAVAQLPLDLDGLDCDFYTASCHKWLCAPFGSGFLYVHPRRQKTIQPTMLSWGRLAGREIQNWSDEFQWMGTRDPTPLLSIGSAIEFMGSIGWETFRRRTHWLAQYARRRLSEVTRREPLTPNSNRWYASMAHVPLGPGDGASLQKILWEKHGIEVPIIEFGGTRFIRVSCHLYNTQQEIDCLVEAVRELLRKE